MIAKLQSLWRALTSLRSVTIGNTTIGRVRNLDINTSFDSVNLSYLKDMLKYSLCFTGKIYAYGVFIRYTQREVDELIGSVMLEDIEGLEALLDTPPPVPTSPQYLPKFGHGRASDRLRVDLQKQMMYPTNKEAK